MDPSENDEALLPKVKISRYLGPGCAIEICVLEKHSKSCERWKKADHCEERDGDYILVSRHVYKICRDPSESLVRSMKIFCGETTMTDCHCSCKERSIMYVSPTGVIFLPNSKELSQTTPGNLEVEEEKKSENEPNLDIQEETKEVMSDPDFRKESRLSQEESIIVLKAVKGQNLLVEQEKTRMMSNAGVGISENETVKSSSGVEEEELEVRPGPSSVQDVKNSFTPIYELDSRLNTRSTIIKVDRLSNDENRSITSWFFTPSHEEIPIFSEQSPQDQLFRESITSRFDDTIELPDFRSMPIRGGRSDNRRGNFVKKWFVRKKNNHQHQASSS